MAINYELLRTFLDVAAADTFSKAAARRHITPSAISQQIRALESQLGVQLFERFGRRARLTESGSALLASLKDHFAGIDLAVNEVLEKPGIVRGTVRIGAPGPFSRVWLRPRIVQLMQRHPELVIETQFNVTSSLVRGLVEGVYDFCVLVNEPEHGAIEVAPIFVESFVAVASPRYIEAHGRPQGPREFRLHRYIVFDADQAMHEPWWRASFGRREPLPKQIVARVGSLDEMLALAAQGLGITVLPNYFVCGSIGENRVEALGVVQRNGRRGARNQIYLGWRKGAPPSTRFLFTKQVLLAPGRTTHFPGDVFALSLTASTDAEESIAAAVSALPRSLETPPRTKNRRVVTSPPQLRISAPAVRSRDIGQAEANVVTRCSTTARVHHH